MSSITHLDREDALSLLAGELRGSRLSRSTAHMAEKCPVCLRVWQEAREELALQLASGGQPAESLLERSIGELRESLTPQARENWKRELRQLLKAPSERRLAVIQGASKRFKSPLTAYELLERSKEAMPEEPSESEHFARLAYAVATRSQESSRIGLEALTCMYVANALRARGELKEADVLAAQARVHARHAAISDPLVLADLDKHEGELRENQSRFEEAAFLLAGAVGRYRRYGKRVPLVKALLTLADVQAFGGDPFTARETIEEALGLIDPETEPKLYLYARHNLVFFLCDAGDHAEARRIFEENRPLYGEPPSRWLALRMAWVEARIARAHEEFAEAERHFKLVVGSFAKMGNGYDAALASLDLAELFVAAGQTAKLRAMARGLEVILKSEDLHREATAAVLLFQKALADEQITRNLLEHVRSYLEESRNNPGLRFEPSA